jgi:AAA domain, putative AbiEii toxin, Type IV TA system/AAA ATPase domain
LYVKSISIENLRCFRRAELKLQFPGRKQKQEQEPILSNINLLVGNNGTGKTSVLRALALAALSPVMPQSGFLPYRLVRRAHKEEIKESQISTEVFLHAQDLGERNLDTPQPGKMSITIARKGTNDDILVPGQCSPPAEDHIWEKMYEESPAFFIVGYGATRRVEEAKNIDISAQQKARRLRYQRVASLFEPIVALVPLSYWLPSFEKKDKARFKQVVELLNQLLPEEASFTGEYQDEAYVFEVNGVKTPFDALSDGYRAYIGWIADLFYHLCTGDTSGGKLTDGVGVVLVDEIDLHLHPEWQRSVTASLSVALPNLQFVFTTHSPIVAGSLNRENIFVMETNHDSGESSITQYQERIYGLDAEEVLLSSYFNLNSTRAETFTNELLQLSDKAGLGDKDAAFDFAEKLAEATTTPSKKLESPEEEGRPQRRKQLVFIGPSDMILKRETQVLLGIVAVILMIFWFVGMLIPRFSASRIDWTFGGYIHALLGIALLIIAELTVWTLSRRPAK